MLQAPNIAAAAGAELLEAVSAEITEEAAYSADRAPSLASQPNQGVLDTLQETEGYPIQVRKAGYIQYLDPETLLTLAHEKKLIIRLLHKPGHFVRRGTVVALIWPANQVDEHLAGQLGGLFEIGNVRTPTQDVAYAVNQLVEMAVRAMSAAINDPFTAMTCLDYLGDGLALFIGQSERRTQYFDQHGRLIFVLEPVTSDELLNAALDMLRHASCDNASVLLHMLEVIEVIGAKARSPDIRQKLLRHVSLIEEESQAGKLIEYDRQAIHLSGQTLRTKWGGVS
jgi:uncharacterized membrane protein